MERTDFGKKESYKANLRDFLTVFFKHKVAILIIFSVVVVSVTIVSFIIPPSYEAVSTVLVKYGREYVNRPEVGNSVQPVMSLNQEEVINSEIQIMTSPDLAKRVVEAIGVGKMYPDLVENPQLKAKPVDAAISRFGKQLSVEGVKKSSVIQVSFSHDDPQIAAKAVNLLVDFFREKHLQVFSSPQSSFLESQVAAYRQKLQDSEKNMESFKQRNNVYSLEEQRTLLLNQRTELRTEMLNTQNSVMELQKRLSSLKAQARQMANENALYTQTERDKIIVEAKSKLLGLELNEQDLLRKYTDSNKMVVDVRKQIQIVRNFLREQEAELKSKVLTGNPIFQEAQKDLVRTEADYGAQKAKLATISGQLGQLDREIRNLDLQEKDMQNLKRELTTNEKNYQTYGDKMEEARITDDMNRLKLANISVVQPAAVPLQPSSPKKALNVALSIIFGTLASIGFALMSEHLTQELISPENAERRLNLAVLAAIPYKE
jgi:uncharacterized protein involved in exopolysaccharide biosynthesis